MPQLRDLPSIDRLLNEPGVARFAEQFGPQTVRDILRDSQAVIRSNASNGEIDPSALDTSFYVGVLQSKTQNATYTAIFNLTGTVIHTNLGRALVSQSLWRSIEPIVTRPTNLEYDLVAGRRGQRDAIVANRLIQLTGCEAATIVNNNAAALLLVLNTFALEQEVPVSRGELIEIGGSFRLPELMARAGCTLREVGTTNRTHLKDYEAVAPSAAMMLKVHPSNYHIQGFSAQVEAGELARLAKVHDIPSCVDLGAGTLVDLAKWGLPREPTPQSVLSQGIDLVTFSGDKLLGGVQAGLIVGRRDLIDALNKNPLKRALRADKMTLAALEHTLKLYEHPETLRDNIPLLRTLTLTQEELAIRADALIAGLPSTWQAQLEESSAQIGSGALPDQNIPSMALRITHPALDADSLAKRLRHLSTPVIGRVTQGALYLDLRGADPLDELLENLASLSE
ncbi:MAG: L-seryl-tRNA(Sec) selenium transferase [Pseudomonadota bacterium]